MRKKEFGGLVGMQLITPWEGQSNFFSCTEERATMAGPCAAENALAYRGDAVDFYAPMDTCDFVRYRFSDLLDSGEDGLTGSVTPVISHYSGQTTSPTTLLMLIYKPISSRIKSLHTLSGPWISSMS
jgi:hypothetical protein